MDHAKGHNQEEPDALPWHSFQVPDGQSYPFVIDKISSLNPLAQAGFPHRHDFYEVFYLTQGGGTHYVDFNAFPIKPPTIFFISPGQVQFWKTTEPLDGFGMIFTDEFLRFSCTGPDYTPELSFFHQLTGSPEIRLKGEGGKALAELVQRMFAEAGSGEANRGSILRSWLHIFLTSAERLHAPGGTEPCPNAVSARRFKQLVSENFVQERSVSAYAALLGMSVGHLHEVIKAATGQTPKQIILDELALEAKRLLAHSDLTVAEIGYRLHMDDPAYFGRFFKREVGTSPGEFRTEIREKYQNA